MLVDWSDLFVCQITLQFFDTVMENAREEFDNNDEVG